MRRLTCLTVTYALMLTCAISCAQGSGTPGGGEQVVARFGDQTVSAAKLKELVGARLVQLENQMYQQKVDAIEGYVFEQLVQAEATKAGVPTEEYLRTQVMGKVAEPAAEEVEKVLNQYRRQLPEDEAQARQMVVEHLKQQQAQQAQAAFKQQLFAAAGVTILLDPPRVEFAVQAWNPAEGAKDAPVTLVEYTDFQCPFCSRVQGTLAELMKRYDGKIRHVFKQLPLDMHQQARFAAEASLCAADQDKFWLLRDWMFQNQKSINRETVDAKAAELGLDMERFKACVDGKTHAANVQADLEEARGFGITGTPAFLVNGRVVTGAQPTETFARMIDEELRRAGVAPPASN